MRARTRSAAACPHGVRLRGCVPLLLALLLLGPQGARAYGDRAAIELERFRPAPGDAHLVVLDLARTGEHRSWVPQGFLHYADRPLVLLCRGNCSPQSYVPWVAHRLTLDLSVALSLFDRIQLALSLPAALYQYSDPAILDPPREGPLPSGLVAPVPKPAGLGNLKLHAKVAFLPRRSRFGLGLAGALGLPTGDGDSFLGTRLPDFSARLLGHVELRRLTLALHLGARFGETIEVKGLHTGTDLLYGLGGQLQLLGPGADEVPLYLVAEVHGAAHIRFSPDTDFPTELLIAARAEPARWSLTAGVGATLFPGTGTPNVRGFIGLGYSSKRGNVPIQ